MENLNKKKKQLNNYAKYTGLGIQMLVIIGAGVFGGYYLDSWLGNKFPVFLILLSLLSVGIAIYTAIKDFIK
jgi:F0F1-type ATP synthase assembly protein I